MTGLDTIRGAMINSTDGKMIRGVIKSGEDFRFEFEARSAGEFYFQCNMYCGVGCENLKGLIMGEP